MKILIIMEGFLPGKKYGGPPVSVNNFCSLMKDHNCYIVTHNHDMGETKLYSGITDGWNDRGNCKVLYLADESYNRETFKTIMLKLAPDIIYLQGLFQSCIFPCLRLAKKYKIPVLLAPRGELCTGAFNIRKWKKLPYIEFLKALGDIKNIHWQSTSDEETEAIKTLISVDDNCIHKLDNIPSIPRAEYTRRKKTIGEARFVFLSRIHPKKNLLFAISLFEDIEGEVKFDVYGPIEDEEYWRKCQDKIKKLPANVKVEYKGLVEHDDVHKMFSQYDAFLFPTCSENYGHVIVESMIAGTPVIISNQTPWRALEFSRAGWDVPLEDRLKFKECIHTVIRWDSAEMSTHVSEVKKYINKRISWDNIRKNYSEAIHIIKS